MLHPRPSTLLYILSPFSLSLSLAHSLPTALPSPSFFLSQSPFSLSLSLSLSEYRVTNVLVDPYFVDFKMGFAP